MGTRWFGEARDGRLRDHEASTLATALAFARETPRLRFNAVELGLILTTGLGGRDAGGFVRFLQRYIFPLLVQILMPFIKILSTPKRAALVQVLATIGSSDSLDILISKAASPTCPLESTKLGASATRLTRSALDSFG